MKRIGIISGVNPRTALYYYDRINTIVAERLGTTHTADCVIRIPDADSYRKQIGNGRSAWHNIEIGLCIEARNLHSADECKMIAIASNTLNKVVPYIQEREIPIMNIGQVVAIEAKEKGVTSAILLGTKTVMEEDFIKAHLRDEGIEIVDDFCDREIMTINNAVSEKQHGYDVMSSSRALKQICLQAYERDCIDGVIVCSFELSNLIDGTFTSLLLNKYNVQVIDSTEAQIKAMANFCIS